MISVNKKALQVAILAGLFINLSACQDSDNKQNVESGDNGEPKAPKQEIMNAPMMLDRQIEFAKEDLSERLSVPVDSVKLSGTRRVNWRSGALGCPKPGSSYTDALVPGVQILLQVDNMIHAYHSKFDGEPFYCPRERVEQPVIDDSSDLT